MPILFTAIFVTLKERFPVGKPIEDHMTNELSLSQLDLRILLIAKQRFQICQLVQNYMACQFSSSAFFYSRILLTLNQRFWVGKLFKDDMVNEFPW